MPVKVFCDIPTTNGYYGNPVEGFQIEIKYTVHQSDGGDNNDARWFKDVCWVDVPVGGSPQFVFANAFDSIKAACLANGYPEPTKDDVFGYVPAAFSSLLPDQPAIA